MEEALCFGWIDSTVNRLDAHRFKQLFTPRKPGGTWARTNKERVERLIAAGLMTPAGLAPIEAAKADGSWTLLDDVEGLVVPEDLASALHASPAAERGFHDLPDSQKKMALYWIQTAKTTGDPSPADRRDCKGGLPQDASPGNAACRSRERYSPGALRPPRA